MRFKARIFSTTEPASDSSMISARIAEEFFASDKFKQALADRRLFGTLTHAARNLKASKNYTPELAKTIGKDDELLLDLPMTHILTKAWLEPDGWAYGEFEVLDKTGMDDEAIQKIKRLEGLLLNRCRIGISCVILGYWENKDGHDYLSKFVELKGCDLTCNPSWKNAFITNIDTSDYEKEEKTFSEIDKDYVYNPKEYEDNRIMVKQFSIINSDLPKSSKINGKYTVLKAKDFSFNAELTPIEEDTMTQETSTIEQKEFSQGDLKIRLREFKLGPRQYFRRIYMSYRQVVKSMGGPEKMKEEDLKVLKSLFTSDVLLLLNSVQNQVLQGKQLNTLLGCSSISKNARVLCQNLQIPLRYAYVEVRKQGFLSKMRYQKLQDAYMKFISGLIEDIFGPNPEPIKEEPEEENEK